MAGHQRGNEREGEMGTCTSTKQNNRGVSLPIHPVLGRYAPAKPRVDKWGRWVEIDIIGKNKMVTTIVGTYHSGAEYNRSFLRLEYDTINAYPVCGHGKYEYYVQVEASYPRICSYLYRILSYLHIKN